MVYTAESKAKIDAARKAYDDLTNDQKALISEAEYKVLTDAEAAYAKLKADHEAADAVKTKINAIGDVVYTAESKAKIDEARAAYNALTDDQKALVDNYSTLTAAKEAYDTLKAATEKEIADRNTAGTVTGIVIASVALCCCLFFLLFLILKKRKKDEDENKN